MKKRLLSALLCLALMVTVMPFAAPKAAAVSQRTQSLDFTQTSIPGGPSGDPTLPNASLDNLTAEGWKYETDADGNATLTLQGLDMAVASGTALNINIPDKTLKIVLIRDTAGAKTTNKIATDANAIKIAAANVTVEGAGELQVTAATGTAMAVDATKTIIGKDVKLTLNATGGAGFLKGLSFTGTFTLQDAYLKTTVGNSSDNAAFAVYSAKGNFTVGGKSKLELTVGTAGGANSSAAVAVGGKITVETDTSVVTNPEKLATITTHFTVDNATLSNMATFVVQATTNPLLTLTLEMKDVNTVFGILENAEQKNIAYEVPLYVTMAVTGGEANVTVPTNYDIKNSSVVDAAIGVVGMKIERVLGTTWDIVQTTPGTLKEIKLSVAGLPMPALNSGSETAQVLDAANLSGASFTSPLGTWDDTNSKWVPTAIAKDAVTNMALQGTVQAGDRTDLKAAAQFVVTYCVSAVNADGTLLTYAYAGNDLGLAGFVDPRI